jgi:hypothetical protein
VVFNSALDRIKLEKNYLDDLGVMTSKIQKNCTSNGQSLIQQGFMNYVDLANINKPHKQQYINQLQAQCDALVKFKVRNYCWLV